MLAAEWTAKNPHLRPGEWGVETDTGKVKIGTRPMERWTALPYYITATVPVEHSHSHSDLEDLDSDDHPQYHNEERADAWLAEKTADDLAEGSTHLFLTPSERTTIDTIDETYSPLGHVHSGDDIVGGEIDGGSA